MKNIENIIPFADGHKHAKNFKNIKGKTFGRLTVGNCLGFVLQKNNKRRVVWEAHCKCGTKIKVRGNDLATGSIVSCGCKNKERIIIFNKATKTKSAYNTFSAVWQSYRRGAIDRGYCFDLTKDQFYELTQGNCNYCGTNPSQTRKPRCKGKLSAYVYNGIDRLDNHLGYITSNCVPCCGKCNIMKGAMSVDDFKEKIKTIYNYFINK